MTHKNKQTAGFPGQKNTFLLFFVGSGIKVYLHNNYTFDPAPWEESTPTGSMGLVYLPILYTTYYFAIKKTTKCR